MFFIFLFFSFEEHEKPIVTGVLLKDTLDYNMNHRKRGIAIIFNHENFNIPQAEPRSGTNADSKKLKKTLKHLGFKVRVHKDLTTKDIFKKLENGI